MQPNETDETVALLAGRGVVAVRGEDDLRFLQGLLTGDVERLPAGADAIHAGLLSPQGKILFEMIVMRGDSEVLLDVAREAVPELVKRLGFYKLRAKVEIVDRCGDMSVWSGWGETYHLSGNATCADPRASALGHRAIARITSPVSSTATMTETQYHAHRIACGVPELGQDFGSGEVFPHEALWDLTGSVDFEKGCYVGQEVVSRMQHRGTARSRFVIVEGEAELPPRGAAVKSAEVPLGVMGSHVGNMGLALLRLDRLAAAKAPVETGGVRLIVKKPAFARFDVPGGAA